MTSDPLDLQGIDYVEFYVSNARQAAHFYRTALGLRPVAYAGLETGVRDRASWVLARRNIRFVLTAPLLPDPRDPIAAHIARHGDGVHDMAALEGTQRQRLVVRVVFNQQDDLVRVVHARAPSS